MRIVNSKILVLILPLNANYAMYDGSRRTQASIIESKRQPLKQKEAISKRNSTPSYSGSL